MEFAAYDVWHDRAVFHFLTAARDRAAYVRQVARAVKPGGHVIVVKFAMGGVPSMASSPGIDFVEKPADYGERKRREYITNDYHKPTDQVKPDWDLRGAVEDLRVLLEVGYRVAQTPARPVWTNKPSRFGAKSFRAE